MWNALPAPEALLLAFLWLCALGARFSYRETHPVRLAPGLIGNVILVSVFLLTPRMAGETVEAHLPFLRISIGIGGWIMAFAYSIPMSSKQAVVWG